MTKYERFIIYPLLILSLVTSFVGMDFAGAASMVEDLVMGEIEAEKIQVERLEVVDEEGEVMIVLGRGNHGGSGLAMYDQWGRSQLVLEAAMKGGMLVVRNSRNNHVASVGVSEKDEGGLWVFDKEGEDSTHYGYMDLESPY